MDQLTGKQVRLQRGKSWTGGDPGSGSKQSNKPESSKSKASSGLPKLDVAAAASHASETAAGE